MPIFDFAKQCPKPYGTKLKLMKGNILMLEGIHCLNDKLTPGISRKNKFKIFIAPLPQLNLDEFRFVSNTLNRLVRRIVRDHHFRKYPLTDTLKRWPGVKRNEDQCIFPFMKEAGFGIV